MRLWKVQSRLNPPGMSRKQNVFYTIPYTSRYFDTQQGEGVGQSTLVHVRCLRADGASGFTGSCPPRHLTAETFRSLACQILRAAVPHVNPAAGSNVIRPVS